jgi:hypothetical protein
MNLTDFPALSSGAMALPVGYSFLAENYEYSCASIETALNKISAARYKVTNESPTIQRVTRVK